ncbi:hypothetical protein E2C01_053001 [Portunus trituberculatus]|uniref:Uncharacterized protein n=1 Tax=Portunus trituberculatus TaxID=210409 RepID=A0A5B7GNA5_PORTR|nr:hypothetical protein [Portunus trituberculatus]
MRGDQQRLCGRLRKRAIPERQVGRIKRSNGRQCQVSARGMTSPAHSRGNYSAEMLVSLPPHSQLTPTRADIT